MVASRTLLYSINNTYYTGGIYNYSIHDIANRETLHNLDAYQHTVKLLSVHVLHIIIIIYIILYLK